MAALYELVNIVDGSQPQLTPSELVSLTSSNLALINMTRKAWFDWFFIFHVYINIIFRAEKTEILTEDLQHVSKHWLHDFILSNKYADKSK